jgi:hypothetical protein
MSRRSIIAGIFVLGTTLLSAMYYEFYFAVDRIAPVVLVETGDTTYYAPENQVWVATKVVMFSTVFVGAGMLAMMFLAYLLTTVMCNQEINAAIRDCERLGGEVTSAPIKVCHWYSYDWSVTGKLPNGDKYTRSNSEDYFEEMRLVRS